MTTLVDAPARVDGVQLIGEMVGSGYRNPPALVRRADGQVLQLTPLLYLVLNAVDGRRSCAEIADVVGRGLSRNVSAADIATLVDGHLRPLGLLRRADGSEPEVRRSNPLLALKLRVAVTDPRTTHRLTDPFRVLFRPVVGAAVLLGFVRSSAGCSSSAASAPRRTTPSSGRTCCCSCSWCRCCPGASTSSGTPPQPATAEPSPASWGPGCTSSGRPSTPT